MSRDLQADQKTFRERRSSEHLSQQPGAKGRGDLTSPGKRRVSRKQRQTNQKIIFIDPVIRCGCFPSVLLTVIGRFRLCLPEEVMRKALLCEDDPGGG